MYIFLSPLESVSIFRLLSNDLTKEQLRKFKNVFPLIMKPGDYCHIIYTRYVKPPPLLHFKFDIFRKLNDPECLYEYKAIKIFE